jgi:hypothetical protein
VNPQEEDKKRVKSELAEMSEQADKLSRLMAHDGWGTLVGIANKIINSVNLISNIPEEKRSDPYEIGKRLGVIAGIQQMFQDINSIIESVKSQDKK